MSSFYGDQHRALQDKFETRKMADLMEQAIFKTALDDMDKQFVSTRDMFFLSTLDHQGRPTVSYKGMYRMEEFGGVVDPSRTVFVTEAHESLSATTVAANQNTDFRYLHFFLASHLPFGLHPRIASDLRHPGGINALFFDGHAATMRQDKFDPGYPLSLALRLRYTAAVTSEIE